MSMLRVQNLYKTYPSFALKDVSFSLESGRIMGLISKNGAGKSTTLKAMLGMVSPDSGKVEMLGRDFYADEAQCKQALGVVLGGIDFYKEKRLAQITRVTKRFYARWDEDAYARYMQMFALDEGKRVKELSEGMKVKYLIALALSHHAQLSFSTSRRAGSIRWRARICLRCFASSCRMGSAAFCFRRISRPILRNAPTTSRTSKMDNSSPAPASKRLSAAFSICGTQTKRRCRWRRSWCATRGGCTMSELFVKEWTLAAPAVDVMFVFLGALVLVPAYPYGMVFFFGMLAAFFSCQFARENADIFYTMLLPVCKRDVVKGKMMLIVSIELAQLALTIPFAIVRTELLPNGNPVGIEANVAYFGCGLVIYAVFNFIFLSVFFRDAVSVGKAFVFAVVPATLLILCMEAAVHLPALAWLDGLSLSDQLRQLPILVIGVAFYVASTALTYRIAARNFSRVDL